MRPTQESENYMIVDLVLDRLRKLADNSWLLGLHDFNAASGGTGSGLACLMLERAPVDYGIHA